MRMIKSILTISGYTALSRILGFIRDILIAKYLGAGSVADAFFISFKFPNFFRRLFAEGALNAVFVPIFARLYTSKGLRAACEVGEQVYAVLFTVLIIFVIFVELTIQWLMYGIAPGFAAYPEKFELAIHFTRITFPYILFISLAMFLGGILNALNRFTAAASAPVLLNLVMILSIAVFLEYFATSGHALVWGIFVAGIAQYLWLKVAFMSSKAKLRFVRPALTPAVKQVLTAMIPGAIGAGIMQVNLLVDLTIASLLPAGSISFLFYADRLIQLPLSLIGTAISTALLPILAKHLQRKEHQEAHNKQNRCIEFGLLITAPASMGLCLLAAPILSMLFERGAYGPEQVLQTSYVLAAYSLGLPAYVLSKVFSTHFFAQYDTKTPVIAGMISLGVNIVLNLTLMQFYGIMGIAIATTISAWVNMGYLGYRLYKLDGLRFDEQLKNRLPKLALATTIMSVLLISAKAYFGSILQSPSTEQKLILSGIIAGGMCLYALSCLVLKVISLTEAQRLIKKTS